MDPYFSEEHVGLIKEIQSRQPHARIRVITGVKGKAKYDPEEFEDRFIYRWKNGNVATLKPIEITLVQGRGGYSPLHQRYLLADFEGLDLGAGWDQLGKTEGKMTRFDTYELEEIQAVRG